MSQSASKLEIWEALKTAYSSLWLQRRSVAGWSAVPVLLVAVIDLLARPFVGGLDQILQAEPGAQWHTGIVVAGQLRTVLQLAVWTVLELACYRLFLLGPGSELPASQMRAIYLSLLAFNVALTAVAIGPNLVFDYARITSGNDAWEAVSLIYFFFYLFIGVRLAFVFPAISIGNPWALRQRWAETEGNFWRLLLVLVLAYLPMFLISGLFSSLGINVTGSTLSPEGFPVFEALARSVVTLVLLLSATAVTAAAVSQLTGHRAAGMTGQGPGPTDIASRFD